MAFVVDMDPSELSAFLLEKKLLDNAQVEKFLLQDIAGDTVVDMSPEQLMTHVGYSFVKATRLVTWLKTNVNSTQLKAGSKDQVHIFALLLPLLSFV